MRSVGVLLVIGSMVPACQRSFGLETPSQIPPQSFFDSVRTVAVAPTSVVGDISIEDSTLTYLESLIEEHLREAGLTVVPAIEYAEIWDSIANESGGFFDPYTGERDEEKFQAAANQLMAVMSQRFEYDALAYPEIWEVETPFSDGDARWGGAAQLIPGGRGYSGDVRAATLFVAIQDSSGNELYVQEAGIQVLEYMLMGRLTPLPPERLFADTTFIPAAVSRALDPLVELLSPIPP